MNDRKKIILLPNSERDICFETTLRVKQMLDARGRSTAVCKLFDDITDCALPDGVAFEDFGEQLENAELIIAFGGDGTILRTARMAADVNVPILGVNMGGKGFMAELEPVALELIDDVAEGKYTLEQRMMLDVEIHRGGEIVYSDFALNDVVIRGDNKVIDLMLFGDGQVITHFSGDGAVIATPTGSTAYSMAAGGPIVEEAAENIIVTPICAHVIAAKSFVLVPDRLVSVSLGDRRNNPAFISVDGGDHHAVLTDDVINVFKSLRHTQLVRLSNRNFYKKVSEKLGEAP
ncbi:MAG: NAD(+)/NADH kinase [Oscillospiraceae bacterium]|nr:NAD(+)/NADH kinase [Oscillospiraceae bacterium]